MRKSIKNKFLLTMAMFGLLKYGLLLGSLCQASNLNSTVEPVEIEDRMRICIEAFRGNEISTGEEDFRDILISGRQTAGRVYQGVKKTDSVRRELTKGHFETLGGIYKRAGGYFRMLGSYTEPLYAYRGGNCITHAFRAFRHDWERLGTSCVVTPKIRTTP